MTKDKRERLVLEATMRMLELEIKREMANSNIRRLAFLSVRFINLSHQTPEENFDSVEPAIQMTINILASLTPNQLLQTFPVEKRYDGARWETKDYFTTMAAIAEHHQAQPIGRDAILDLLWDYENWDITRFLVNVCGLISEYSRRSGKKDPFDIFFLSPRYTAADGAQYVSDNDGTPILVREPRMRLVPS